MAPLTFLDGTGLRAYDMDQATIRGRIEFQENNLVMTGRSGAKLNMQGFTVDAPTENSDPVNKSYVDAAINGLHMKTPATAASTANVTLASIVTGFVLDGVTLADGDRVLLKDQTTASENGLYEISASPPARPSDFASASSSTGVYVFVDKGTVNVDRAFVCVSDAGSDVVDTNDLSFIQFSARPLSYAGTGLVVGANNALDVDTSLLPFKAADDNVFSGVRNVFSNEVVVGTQGDPTATVFDPSGVTAQKMTGLDTSQISGASDAVNVEYLQFVVKLPVRAASVDNVDLASLTIGSIVDDVTLADGDRVLLTGQTATTEKGVYTVSSGVPVRANDFASGGASGALLLVLEGTIYGRRQFAVVNAIGSDAIGTDNLAFQVTSSGPGKLAGSGIELNTADQTLNLKLDSQVFTVNGSNELTISSGALDGGSLTDNSVANAKLMNDDVTVNIGRGLLNGGGNTDPQVVDLGQSATINVDHTVVPDLLAASNTFTGDLAISSTTASSDPTTGALTVAGGLGVNGSIQVAQGVYNYSDERLKESITVIPDALDKVSRMRGVDFTWKHTKEETVGVIAQEIVGADAAKAVNQEGKYMTVDYTKLVPYLIEAVKDLKRKVEDLSSDEQPRKRSRKQ